MYVFEQMCLFVCLFSNESIILLRHARSGGNQKQHGVASVKLRYRFI